MLNSKIFAGNYLSLSIPEIHIAIDICHMKENTTYKATIN